MLSGLAEAMSDLRGSSDTIPRMWYPKANREISQDFKERETWPKCYFRKMAEVAKGDYL